MATRVSPAEVIEMQRLYRIYGTYAAVAREMGRSADTVSKFVQMKGVPQSIRIAVQKFVEKLEVQ